VREALAKGVAIDLHPRAFKTADAAATLVSHVAVQLWQVDDAPTYELAVARGFALSFWHWLATSAAEFGLELVGNAPSIRGSRCGWHA
jgi:sarcosine oxidase subunit gamma